MLPVHLYGQAVEIDRIADLAKARGLRLIEDAAQAHGARCRGQRIGAHGDAVCWSFYPGKNLGAMGDGGAVTTNNEEIADRIRLFGNYGSRKKYVNEAQGVNSRLDPLQAAILRAKLAYLDEWTARRKDVAASYTANLSGTSLVLPFVPDWADPVWHLYVVSSPRRDEFQQSLAAAGICTLIHYPIPPHMQQAYAELNISPQALPVANDLASSLLSLPMGPHIGETEVHFISNTLINER